MSRAINSGKNSSPQSIYYVTFEDYLKPKYVGKANLLQKPELRLKLLEDPLLIAAHKSKWLIFKEKLDGLKLLIKKSNNKMHILRAPPSPKQVCKVKSDFQIYCEMASIHGFQNFVGASTWQKTFWFLVVFMAVVMSGSIVLLSHFMSTDVPTILYSENTQYPTWSIPFPAVTICNINRISKSKAESLAEKFQNTTNMTIKELTTSFKFALSTTENIKAASDDHKKLNEILKLNNYTMFNLLKDIAPNCDKELLRCTYRGGFIRCGHIFKKIQTLFGPCCSFNALNNISIGRNAHMEYISNSGYINGLTVLLDPHLPDYKASSFLIPGFQVFVHDASDFVDMGTMQRVITPATANKIRIWPQQTYATDDINSLEINVRKCYLPNERKLYHFGSYSQANCFAECRSLMFFEKCQCALPYRPKMHNWTMCGLEDIQCYIKYKYILLSSPKRNEKQFLCDCYPLCNFHMYKTDMITGGLTRKYSITEQRLYSGINVTNQILLQVYISELHAERLRLDVYENWLTFIGTFGGITGLFMGYSFLSGFELIFFIFVRPACNWWNKRQIHKHIKKRKQAEQEKKQKQ